MYKQSSKRKRTIRLALVYTFMTLAVITIVTVLVLIMLGYRFNRGDGSIEAGGLVQFASRPTGATVSVDGASLGVSTNGKATLTTGNHTIEYTRDGYQPWKKDVVVNARSILWLDYARLVPTKLTPESVVKFEQLGSSVASIDRRAIAAIERQDQPVLSVVRLESTPRREDIAIPAELYSDPTEEPKNHVFTVNAWDKDTRSVLIHHSYGPSGSEWLVINTTDMARSQNVTRLLGVDASKVSFSLDGSHMLYAIVDNALRKINLNDATLSRPLVPNIADYRQYDRSTITYETLHDEQTGGRSVGYYTDNAKSARTVRQFSDTGQLRFRLEEYYGDKFYVIQHGDTVDISKGDIPSSDNDAAVNYERVASFTVPGGVDDISFNKTGRFVLMPKNHSFLTYDLELRKMNQQDIAAGSSLRWMDEFILLADGDGQLRSYEFDGLNSREYMPVVAGQAASLSRDNRYLYGFANGEDGMPALMRVKLIL